MTWETIHEQGRVCRWYFLSLILWEKGLAKQHGENNAEYLTVHNLHGKCLQSNVSSSYKNQPKDEYIYIKIVLFESVQSIYVSKHLQFIVYIFIYLSKYKNLSHLALNSFMMNFQGPKNRHQGPEEEEPVHLLSVLTSLTFEEFLKHQTSSSLDWDWIKMVVNVCPCGNFQCIFRLWMLPASEDKRFWFLSRDETFKHDVRRCKKVHETFMSKQIIVNYLLM